MQSLAPQALLEWASGEKKVLVVEQQSPSGRIFDLSLHKKGPIQDKTYLTHPDIYRRLRRGLSLLQVGDQLLYLKKGLPKFFDVEKAFFGKGELPFLKKEAKSLSVLQGGQSISMHFKRKENGQHCQISYCAKEEAWVVGSKNVTILVKDESSFQHLQQIRYTWPVLIAKLWFKTVAGMATEQAEALKRRLGSATLLGQYVGQALHQHIVRYGKEGLRFYAGVNHDSEQLCMTHQEISTLLKEFGLEGVQVESLCGLNFEEYLAKLEERAAASGSATLQAQGEGLVLYCESGGRVRSICKLKTTEYLIFRRLRELLKQLLLKEESSACFSRFRSDLLHLLAEDYPPPRPVSFYEEVARVAFYKVGEGVEFLDLRYRFVDFIEQIVKEVDSKGPLAECKRKPKRIVLLTLPGLLDQTCLQRLAMEHAIRTIEDCYKEGVQAKEDVLCLVHLVPRLPLKEPEDEFIVYSAGEKDIAKSLSYIEPLKSAKNPSVFSLIRSADKPTSLRLLHDKIQSFYKSFKDKYPSRIRLAVNQEQLGLQLDALCYQQKSMGVQGIRLASARLTVVVPITIPGAGKSTIARTIRTTAAFREGRVTIISPDELRAQVLKKLRSEGKLGEELTQEQVFKQTGEQTKQLFQAELAQALAQPPTIPHIIYLDKNHSPSNLQKTLKFILSKSQYVPKVVGLVPTLQSQKIGSFEYPFSLEFLTCCLFRSILREQHSTLCTDPVFTAKVIVKFFQYFKEFSFKNARGIGLDELVQVEMGQEGLSVGSGLRKAVLDCLKLTKAGQEPPDSPVFVRLVEQLFKSGLEVQLEDLPQSIKKSEFLARFD